MDRHECHRLALRIISMARSAVLPVGLVGVGNSAKALDLAIDDLQRRRVDPDLENVAAGVGDTKLIAAILDLQPVDGSLELACKPRQGLERLPLCGRDGACLSPATAALAGSIASKASIANDLFMASTARLPSFIDENMRRHADGLLKNHDSFRQLPVSKIARQLERATRRPRSSACMSWSTRGTGA